MDPQRLERRFEFFCKITLPSLACQTDTDFRHIVLSSKLMPQAYRKKLQEACFDVLGTDRAHVIFRRPGPAKAFFKRYMKNHMEPAEHSAQIVLDDDDGLSKDFVATLRQEAGLVTQTFHAPKDYSVLSFPRGLSAVITPSGAELCHRHVAFTNLGLSVVGQGYRAPSPYGMAHLKIPFRRPSRAIYTRLPLYVRAVHDHNDSKGNFCKDAVTPEQLPDLFARFPYLRPLVP